MEYVVLIASPAAVGLALLFLGVLTKRSEQMFFKKAIKKTACVIGYKPIKGTLLVNPRVWFFDGSRGVKAICQTAGIKVEHYPPGAHIEICYLREPVLDKYVYEVRPSDEKIRSNSSRKLGNFLIVLSIIFIICFVLLLTLFFYAV